MFKKMTSKWNSFNKKNCVRHLLYIMYFKNDLKIFSMAHSNTLRELKKWSSSSKKGTLDYWDTRIHFKIETLEFFYISLIDQMSFCFLAFCLFHVHSSWREWEWNGGEKKIPETINTTEEKCFWMKENTQKKEREEKKEIEFTA